MKTSLLTVMPNRRIEDVLSNDENSTNAELVEYFLKQGLSRLQSESVLRHREEYLLNLYRIGEGPLHY